MTAACRCPLRVQCTACGLVSPEEATGDRCQRCGAERDAALVALPRAHRPAARGPRLPGAAPRIRPR